MNIATCEQIEEQLDSFLEGSLDAGGCQEVGSHLRGCAACREQVRRSREVRDRLRGAFAAPLRETAATSQRLREIASGPQLRVEEREAAQAAAPGLLDTLATRFGAAPWWLISGAFHALLLLLLTLIGMTLLRSNTPDTVILTSLEKKLEPPEDEKPKERDVFKNPAPVEMPVTQAIESPVVLHEEAEIAEHDETDQQMDSEDAFGDEGISDIPMGGSGVSGALGLGGGGAGAFGRPLGGGRQRLARAVAGGGSKATESAVDLALEWLARHQEPDGHWDIRKHGAAPEMSGDMGVTGLAVLAFLGAGHTEKVGKYKDNVCRALQWIVKNQDGQGALRAPGDTRVARFEYGQAIAGMALAEAAAMGRVPETKAAAQKAINYATEVMQKGNGSERLFWDYGKPPDMSINGWFIMFLKSAKVAGLHVDPASFEGAIKFLDLRQADPVSIPAQDRAESGDSGGHRYGYRSTLPLSNTTAIGVLCRLFTGTPPEEVSGAAAWMLKNEPAAWDPKLGKGNLGPWPMYYAYYNTLTMFQVGGHLWTEWNKHLKEMLLPNQRKDGDFNGSWDPLGDQETTKGGRVYSTALGALCLEVYYRYLPLYRY